MGELLLDQQKMEAFDAVEAWLAMQGPLFNCDQLVENYFADGMYIRKIFMPAGWRFTSKIHKTRHPFFILQGELSVFSEGEGEVHYKAPIWGITEAGTRRLLLIHSDTIWITCHATEETDLEKIEEHVIHKHINPAIAYQRVLDLLSNESPS
jgi:hypothetical protein